MTSAIISFNPRNCCLECSSCGERIPIGKFHVGSNQFRFAEEKRMAEELHQDCAGRSRAQLIAQMAMRTVFDGGRRPDRLVYSV